MVEGAKATGKTATARQIAASEVLLDVDANARRAVEIDPSLILRGPVPRLIDEWQTEPALWNHVRREVDNRGRPGQFILTGSAVPADDTTRHTGAGRLSRLRLRTMTLFETGSSTGVVSLAGLLDGEPYDTPEAPLSVQELAELISRGGWPGHLTRATEQALQANRDYLDEIRRTDVARVDGKSRDPVKLRSFLRSLARNVGTPASVATLAADTGGADGAISQQTAHEYMDALERLMIVENQPAWAPHLRSRSVLRSSPRRHFVDPSLAVAALGATPDRLLQDLELMGFLFESLVVRDLRVYGQALGAEVLQYRDNTGLEVDAVVQTADGRWAAFEIKLGHGQIDEAAQSLLTFRDRVDTSRIGAPSALAVVTPGGYTYQRGDGIWVVPLAVLGP